MVRIQIKENDQNGCIWKTISQIDQIFDVYIIGTHVHIPIILPNTKFLGLTMCPVGRVHRRRRCQRRRTKHDCINPPRFTFIPSLE